MPRCVIRFTRRRTKRVLWIAGKHPEHRESGPKRFEAGEGRLDSTAPMITGLPTPTRTPEAADRTEILIPRLRLHSIGACPTSLPHSIAESNGPLLHRVGHDCIVTDACLTRHRCNSLSRSFIHRSMLFASSPTLFQPCC